MNTALSTTTAPQSAPPSMFYSAESFDLLQRQAEYIAKSDLLPKEFKDKPANCAIAMEMAIRLGAGYFQVIQNMAVIHGRPSFSASFLMGMINASGRFGPLEYQMEVTGVEKTVAIEYEKWEGFGPNAKKVVRKINYTYTPTTCRAVAEDKRSGKIVVGPPVSYDMAIAEGWVAKDGSKWQSPMRELMLTYRAGAFFARVYASDMTLGMRTTEELQDITPAIEVQSEVLPPRQELTTENPHRSAPAATEAPKRTRPPKPATETSAPAAPPAAAPKGQAMPPQSERGMLVCYEKVVVQQSPENAAKPWTKYTLHYQIPGGDRGVAQTFSDGIVMPLENADEGTMCRIETEPNPNPKYAPKLTYLVIAEGYQSHTESTEPAVKSEAESDIPWE